MVCIYCAGPTSVSNSRLQKRTNETWRRRQCTSCGSIFTTYEMAELAKSIVVQYSTKVLVPFQRDVLFASIYDSCKHQEKAAEYASALTQTIISDLIRQITNGIIQRDAIVAACSSVLERFDPVAATMYGAYHKI